MKPVIRSLKGTRDFYPEEMKVLRWLQEKVTEVSEQFGYELYDGPYLERVELYAAKSGDELVKEQAFVFEDRGGDLITLRPELTPTLARMVAEKQRQLVFPLRWFAFGPFWRYERPQRGRTREFFQWNIDMIGVSLPEADAEMVAVCAAFFHKVGLTPGQVRIKVNDRQLVERQLRCLGIEASQFTLVFKAIDRKAKMRHDEWMAFVAGLGLTQEQVAGLILILQDENGWEGSESLRRMLAALQAMGWQEYVEYAPEVIRGLDYYTGVVFEAIDVKGGRAILGGGHYDNLVGAVGGELAPGVGFAMGDVMISLVLEDYGLLPTELQQDSVVLVSSFDENFLVDSFQIASALRASGIKAMAYPEPARLIKQFKYADRKGIRFVVVMGPDEKQSGTLTIKDLSSGTQTSHPIAEAVEMLHKILA